jgi:integrase
MRLAHHLLRHPKSGIWHFRLVVPKDLRPMMGVGVIKRSLHTKDPIMARTWAYTLGARYAQIFANARLFRGEGAMGGFPWDEDEEDAAAEATLRRLGVSKDTTSGWTLKMADGTYFQTNGTREDNKSGLTALDHYLKSIKAHAEAVRAGVISPPCPTLAEAIRDYTDVEAKELKPNTWSQRSRALAGFAETIGAHMRVDAITRHMASHWSDGLLRSDKSKSYVANCVSHVAQLFEALVKKGRIQTNPVKGLVVVKKKEKAARRSLGHEWEPLEVEQLKRIFDPENLAKTRMEHVRWGAIIALYTGARVGEIAQLFLRDFVEIDGVHCLKICADSDGQSIKTGEGGERLVPIHPDLIKLGLVERVERLRAAGEERLFPDMRIDSAAGKGNAISKGFGYYLKSIGIKPRRAHGIVGIHSLRKTVIQTLQGSTLSAERRRAIVGHEAGDPVADTHSASYMRPWTAKELAAFHPGLPWGDWLQGEKLRTLLKG